LDLANKPDNFFSTVQIGITLIGILTGIYSGDKIISFSRPGWYSSRRIAEYSNGIATVVVLIIVTFLSLVLGELVPKKNWYGGAGRHC
jgi:putative hemolysin